MSRLILGYQYDASMFDADPQPRRDDFGRLSVKVEIERFSGSSGFWVHWQDLKALAGALGRFPIPDDQPIIARWGYNAREGDDLVISLEVAPADKLGHLTVRFEIVDDLEPRNRLRGCFQTNYGELGGFRAGIGRLMNREVEEAVLAGA